MSRLRGYGPGELLDRLTILSLKRLFGAEAGRDISTWQQEWGVLLVESRPKRIPVEALLELSAINAALWHAEDDLRVLRSREQQDHELETFWMDAARCGFRVQRLNDQRAALVEKVNREAGESGGSDKVTMVAQEEES